MEKNRKRMPVIPLEKKKKKLHEGNQKKLLRLLSICNLLAKCSGELGPWPIAANAQDGGGWGGRGRKQMTLNKYILRKIHHRQKWSKWPTDKMSCSQCQDDKKS